MEMIPQSSLNQIDGEIVDIDSNPTALEPFGHGNGCAATAERIEDNVALIATGFYDSFEKGLGLLSWIAEALGGDLIDAVNIGPNVSDRNTLQLVPVAFNL